MVPMTFEEFAKQMDRDVVDGKVFFGRNKEAAQAFARIACRQGLPLTAEADSSFLFWFVREVKDGEVGVHPALPLR